MSPANHYSRPTAETERPDPADNHRFLAVARLQRLFDENGGKLMPEAGSPTFRRDMRRRFAEILEAIRGPEHWPEAVTINRPATIVPMPMIGTIAPGMGV